MDKELKKILDEIYLERKSHKSIGGTPSSGLRINLDFRDLYPNVMKSFSITSILRREKIKRIFQ